MITLHPELTNDPGTAFPAGLFFIFLNNNFSDCWNALTIQICGLTFLSAATRFELSMKEKNKVGWNVLCNNIS